MKNIKIPNTIEELQAFLHTVIEQYQGEPIEDKNKLNECTAKLLGLKDYASLSKHLKKEQSINVQLSSAGKTIIDGKTINEKVFSNRMVDYRVINREDYVEEFKDIISEVAPFLLNDDEVITLLNYQLEELERSNDIYILKNVVTGDIVMPSKDTEKFNGICRYILNINPKNKLKPR